MKAIEQIRYMAFAEHPELYEQMLLEEYEEKHGAHFDKEHAEEAVAEMRSMNADGTKEKGEHWNIEQIRSAIAPYKDRMKEGDTIWDAYVACNMFWHDMRHQYRKHSQMNADAWMIDDAMHWAFCDTDMPEGKVWYYINMGKRK